MKVHGEEIPAHVWDAVIKRLKQRPAAHCQLCDVLIDLRVKNPIRAVDRWCQQNRKAGLIRFHKGEWHLI